VVGDVSMAFALGGHLKRRSAGGKDVALFCRSKCTCAYPREATVTRRIRHTTFAAGIDFQGMRKVRCRFFLQHKYIPTEVE